MKWNEVADASPNEIQRSEGTQESLIEGREEKCKQSGVRLLVPGDC